MVCLTLFPGVPRLTVAAVNHSCEPNVCFNVSSSDAKDWHMAAVQDINEGDTLCFFYPSTEWDMASPFECNCASKVRSHIPQIQSNNRGLDVLGNHPRGLVLEQGTAAGKRIHQCSCYGVIREKRVAKRRHKLTRVHPGSIMILESFFLS
jgi:hypothetical protein